MGKEAKTPRRQEDTPLNVAVYSNLRRTRSFANRGIIYNLNTLILPRASLGERLRTSSCFFFLLIFSAPLGAQLADSWPIYVYSSHGYNAVKSRSNPPIYGRIQTRVSFITRERAQSHTCDAVELLGLSRDRYSSWSRVAFYVRLVSTRDG